MSHPQQPPAPQHPGAPQQFTPAPPQGAGAPAATAVPGKSSLGLAAAAAGIVGSLIVIGSYLMTWYVAKSDDSTYVTGLGTEHGAVEYSSSKLHWLAGAAAIALLVVAVVSLLGKYHGGWKRGNIVLVVLMVLGTGLAWRIPSSQFEAGAGLTILTVGVLISAIGAGAIFFVNKDVADKAA